VSLYVPVDFAVSLKVKKGVEGWM